MKIVQVNTVDSRGGAAKTAYLLHRHFKEKGHRSTMFVNEKFSSDKNVFLLNKRNYWLDLASKTIGRNLEAYLRGKLAYFAANDIGFSETNNLFNFEEYKKAEIIHCHNLHGNYFNLSSLERISKEKAVVWTLHDMWPITGHCGHSLECTNWQTGCQKCDHLENYEKLFWDNAGCLLQKKKNIYAKSQLSLVVPSLWLKKELEKSILADKEIFLIHYGIDNKIFKMYKKLESRRKIGLPLEKKIITFIAHGGKNNLWKGWEYWQGVIDYYQADKKMFFLCIGNKLKNNHRLKKGNTLFLPYISNESLMAQYYSSSDVFLLASIADNFPFVILEAMACGVPVVSFDVGGVKEAVGHRENGYIAKYKDTKDLIRGIDYVFSLDKKETESLSNNSINKIKKEFTVEKMTRRYLSLYQSLAKRNKSYKNTSGF